MKDLSKQFRPVFMFTLDQIAYIVQCAPEDIENYVWIPGSSGSPGKRMQATRWNNPLGGEEVRVSESQLDIWGEKNNFFAFHRFT